MKVRHVEMLWPYGPDSDKPVDQMDVVVELDDESRWVTSFFDTHRFNKGVKGFRGLGPEKPYRAGPRMVIVRQLDEETIRSAVDAVIESGDFEEAFERVS